MTEAITVVFEVLRHAAPAPEWWTVVQGLVAPLAGIAGVALGAGLSGRRARLNAESARRFEKKADAYLSAIEPIFQLGDQMRVMIAHAPRGGDDPDSDKLAGDAMDAVVETRGQLDRHLFGLQVLGSEEVVTTYRRLRERTDGYFREVSRQLEADGVFRGMPGREYLADLETLTAGALTAMRKDLGVSDSTGAKRWLVSAVNDSDAPNT